MIKAEIPFWRKAKSFRQDPLGFVLWAYTWGKPASLAREPERTLYWLAAEPGMRGGELCGLQFSDFDLERGLVRVNRSVWRGKIQPTKSEHPDRCFALSPQLVHHVLEYLTRWTPNEKGWLFATRNRHSLGSEPRGETEATTSAEFPGDSARWSACGYANSTLMDRFAVPLKVTNSVLGTVIPHLLWACSHMLPGRMTSGLRSKWAGFCTQVRPKTKTARERSLLSRCT